MILRCPKCKFAGAISNTKRLTVDQPLFCPRCQTLMIYPDEQHVPIAAFTRSERQDEQPRRVKWEARASWLDMAAFWQTSKNILFHPAVTFTTLNYDAGISSSLVYLLVYGSLGQIIGRYWFTLLGIRYGILEGNALSNTIHFGGVVLLTPIMLFASIFIVAALVHLVLRILLATQRPFAATFQVMAYASGATSLVNVIPFVGRFIMPIWALVLYFVGLVKAHQTSKTKVFFALLLPLVLAGLFITGIVLLHIVMPVLDFLEAIQQTL